jgi:hypothetical protein
LLGIGAIGGGAVLMIKPDGSIMGMPISIVENTLFKNFFFPGFLLLTFVGIYPLLSAYSLLTTPAWTWPDAINPFKKIHWAWAGSLAAGVAGLVWIVVEMIIMNAAAPAHLLYLGWSLAILGLAALPQIRRYYQKA